MKGGRQLVCPVVSGHERVLDNEERFSECKVVEQAVAEYQIAQRGTAERRHQKDNSFNGQ